MIGVIQIEPARIVCFDQSNLPIAPPFFASDCRSRIFVEFEPDKAIDTVPGGETRYHLALVLVDPTSKIICHTEIESAVPPACEKVYVVGQGGDSFRETVIPGWPAGPGPETMNTDSRCNSVKAYARSVESVCMGSRLAGCRPRLGTTQAFMMIWMR